MCARKRVRDTDPEQARATLRALLAPIVRGQKRYRRSADVQEIERIVPAWRRLLGHPVLAAVPPDVRLWVLREGGRFFLDRYHARGEDEDLQLAVTVGERALADVPVGSQALPQHLSDLGIALRARFLRWGERRDIDRAVACHERAMDEAGPGDPEVASHAENLANALWNRHQDSGSWADLERSAALHRQAARRLVTNPAQRARCLNNLSLALQASYEYTGDLGYLEEAVATARDAVDGSTSSAGSHPELLNTLLIALQMQYQHSGASNDLDLMIRIGQALAAATPPSPAQAMYLHNLGNALLDRYDATAQVDALHEALDAHERALSLIADDSSIRLAYQDDWATALLRRYRLTGEPSDLRKAIETRKELIERLPPGTPELVKYLNNLGVCLLTAPDSASPSTVAKIDRVFGRACAEGLDSNPGEALKVARTWGEWAAGRTAWAEAAVAFGFGISALENLFRTQPLRMHKELWLAAAENVTASAGYALARNGDPGSAALALERGRSLLLSEALQRRRTVLRRLAERGHAGLSERFVAATVKLSDAT